MIEKNKFGFYQVTPTPSAEEITKFYADEFYTGEYKNFNDSSLEVQINDKAFFEGRWNDIYNNFMEINKNIKIGDSILDIGCGWAQALLFFKDKGLDCYGFDPAIEAVEYGCKKGLNIKHAGLEGMNVFDNKKFDMVTMFNVLEHLANPEKSIKDLKNINTELSTILEMFVEKVAQSDSFEVESWLKKNNLNAIADIRLLQKYLQRTFQLFRKQWMEDGYEDYWEARILTRTNFRRADAELSRIIRALINLRRRP